MKPHRKQIANAAAIALMTIHKPMARHQQAAFTGTFDRPAGQPAANDPPAWDVAAQLVAMAPKTARPGSKEEQENAGKGSVFGTSHAGGADAEEVVSDDEHDTGPASVAGGTPESIRAARRDQWLRNMVGARIIAGRELMGLAQHELAQAVGHLTGAQPSQWEHGKRLPPLSMLIKVAQVLGVSLDFLCGLSDEPERDAAAVRRAAVVRELHLAAMSGVEVLADRLLSEGSAVEGQLRAAGLCTKAAALVTAVDRLRAANEGAFDELRGGALVVRLAQDAREAADLVGATLDRADRERDMARRIAVGTVRGAAGG